MKKIRITTIVNIILLLTFSLIFCCKGSNNTGNNNGIGIIIDNNALSSLDSITEADIIAAKSKLHIAYGHTSHGSQLITGMNAIMAVKGDPFTWNEGGTDGALDIDDYAMGGDVGYYPDWVNNTRAYLGEPDQNTGRGSNSAHSDVNVIIWSWCGQVSDRTEQGMIDTYLAPMSQLEADYPGITFVYMTGHTDGTGLDGNLHLRNEQIRDYCRVNNKILFDFETLESYNPDGVYFGDKIVNDNCDYDSNGDGSRESNWAALWEDANPDHELTAISDASGGCAHSQTLNCVQKGVGAWFLWVQIAKLY
ncbi:hypothetical protein ACFL20_02875 [Spirochaetota bacterium]